MPHLEQKGALEREDKNRKNSTVVSTLRLLTEGHAQLTQLERSRGISRNLAMRSRNHEQIYKLELGPRHCKYNDRICTALRQRAGAFAVLLRT